MAYAKQRRERPRKRSQAELSYLGRYKWGALLNRGYKVQARAALPTTFLKRTAQAVATALRS